MLSTTDQMLMGLRYNTLAKYSLQQEGAIVHHYVSVASMALQLDKMMHFRKYNPVPKGEAHPLNEQITWMVNKLRERHRIDLGIELTYELKEGMEL